MVSGVNDHRHYVPILKSKQGEFGALQRLREEDRDRLTPLLDVVRVPFNWKTQKPSKELGEHLAAKAAKFTAAWGSRLAFVDLYDIDLAYRVSGNKHPLLFVFERFREEGATAIPVTGFDRDRNYNNAVKAIHQADGRGVCIRLLQEDLLLMGSLADQVAGMSAQLGVPLERTHLVIDLRELKPRDVPSYSRLVRDALWALDDTTRGVASLVLSASSMPSQLGDAVPTGNTDSLERLEFRFWRSLVANSDLGRLPSFGDYGIVAPDFLELNPKTISIAPTIRYTTQKNWLIMRGISTKKHPDGFKQFHSLAADLVSRPEYFGASCCWGDEYISQNATREVGPGNACKWVEVGTNHHLSVVSRQITALPQLRTPSPL